MQKLLNKVLQLSLNERILLVHEVQKSIDKEMAAIPEENKMYIEFADDDDDDFDPPFQFQNHLNLTPQHINEIAQNLGMDSKVYIHKETKEIIDIPEGMRDYDDGEGLWDEIFEKVDNNPDDYIVIENRSSSDSYSVMEKFATSLDNERLKNKLINALNKRKPFRNFRNVLNYHDAALQDWYAFKQQQAEEYVKRELDYATED